MCSDDSGASKNNHKMRRIEVLVIILGTYPTNRETDKYFSLDKKCGTPRI